jgi:tetratricopeptide (TPR) repeat protein
MPARDDHPTGADHDARTDHAALLALALSRPADAMMEATRLLADAPYPCTASAAHQAAGIVLRDSGRAEEAIARLRLALRVARRCPDPDRATDVQATLGLTLGLSGYTAAALRHLNKAVTRSNGVLGGKVLMRRGDLLAMLGRHEEALSDLRRAITLLHAGGDVLWEGRSRTHRGLSYLALGQTGRAERDFAIAERQLAACGQELELAMAWHNRALVAQRSGELPAALGLLDQAGERYAALGVSMPELASDRCEVLLAAGLAVDALAETDAAVAALDRVGGQATQKAELLFAAATAALAAADPATAVRRAADARDLFRRQGRSWWQNRASFVLLSARHAAGARGARLATQAADIAHRLDDQHAAEAARAHLFAGRLAADRGRCADAEHHLRRAARFRRRGSAVNRAAGWLAQALRATVADRDRDTLLACGRGLAAVEEHLHTLGATELRAHSTAHGAELAAIAQRLAVRRGDARMLLRWSERWRAGVLATPAVRPPEDPALAADLAALRAVAYELNKAHTAGTPTAGLDAERARLEAVIRSRSRRVSARREHLGQPGTPEPGKSGPGTVGLGRPPSHGARLALPGRTYRPSVGEVVSALGDLRLVEIIAVDGVLHVVTVVDGRVRLRTVGSTLAAERKVRFARFQLHRLAFGRPPPGFAERLSAVGQQLEETLLGAAAGDLDGGPIVIVPPGSLHAVPWSLLPSLRTVAVRAAPSAATWLAAHRARPPRRRRVALVVGPELAGTEREVLQIAAGYADPVVLRGGQATAERTLAAIDGAWTAHIAAHGVFRADSPLFSSLRLDDGPLTVHDLARMRRAPFRLVLASCESAVGAPVGADELLGMVGALVPRGTASLLASVVPVNDAATAPLMVRVHERLRAGAGCAQALLAARTAGADDPVGMATGLAFVALGQ